MEPLKPEEVDACDPEQEPHYNAFIEKYKYRFIATVRDRERQIAGNDAWWDDNARQCGNCSTKIVARGGDFKGETGLSRAEGEDESLCGSCAGNQMYIETEAREKAEAERDELQRRLDEARKAVILAAKLTKKIDAQAVIACNPSKLKINNALLCAIRKAAAAHRELRRIAEGKDA